MMRVYACKPTTLVRWGSAVLGLMSFATTAAADQVMPALGGSGGGQFVVRCAEGQLLTGVELRTGNDVDGIRPICASVESTGALLERSYAAASNGGAGGGVVSVLCSDDAPLVNGIQIGYEGVKTQVVNNVHLFCGQAAVNQPPTTYPAAVFDGPPIGVTGGGPFTGGDPVFVYYGSQSCPADLVPVGINGRSGTWLDAVGLLCGQLALVPAPPPRVAQRPIGGPKTSLNPDQRLATVLKPKTGLSSDSIRAVTPEPAAGASDRLVSGSEHAQTPEPAPSPASDRISVSPPNPWLANPPPPPTPAADAQAPAAPVPGAAAPVPSNAKVVISQIYGGGGSAQGSFANDFVELLNRSQKTIDLGKWSIQYAAGNGKEWKVMKLKGKLAPGHYLLIQQSAGSAAGGSPLPTPELKGTLALAASMGKVALMKTHKAIDGVCPAAENLVDFVGYGNANCSENGVPVPALARDTAALRDAGGCIDTNRNAVDLQVTTPAPRNGASVAASCAP